MKEFTVGTVLLGLVMTVVLGAANAYLGLKAGQTIAATYPAAVISMACLRLRKGTILQENLARTAGSIGESVAAGAIFTIPAFVIAGAWPSFEGPDAYWKSTVLMVIGSVLGVLFVSLVRRAMVDDRSLPFPESTAAAEIHKAGQRGAGAAKHLFNYMAVGGVIFLGSSMNFFSLTYDQLLHIGQLGISKVKLGTQGGANALDRRRRRSSRCPTSARLHRRRLHPRTERRGDELRGAVLAWGFWCRCSSTSSGPNSRRSCRPDAPIEDVGRHADRCGASSCGRSRSAACSSARLHDVPHAQEHRAGLGRAFASCRQDGRRRRRPHRALHGLEDVFS
jgi:hypothetical protein